MQGDRGKASSQAIVVSDTMPTQVAQATFEWGGVCFHDDGGGLADTFIVVPMTRNLGCVVVQCCDYKWSCCSM